jgi:hypothetical protein
VNGVQGIITSCRARSEQMVDNRDGPGDGGRAAYEPVEDADSEDALPADAPPEQIALHYATSPHTFFKRLVQHFGWKFTVQLAVMYVLVKGVLNSGIYLVMLPFCQKRSVFRARTARRSAPSPGHPLRSRAPSASHRTWWCSLATISTHSSLRPQPSERSENEYQ